MQRALALMAIFCLGCIVAFAQSAPPAQNSEKREQAVPDAGKAGNPPQEQAGGNKQEPTILQRGTKAAPLVVDVIKAPKKDEESAKEEARADAELNTNRWVMRFTAVLTVFTLLQVVFYFLHRREDNAAYEQEQRAWVGFSEVALTKDFAMSGNLAVSVKITNSGRTPATNVRVRVVTAYDTEFPTVRDDYKGDPITIGSPISQGTIAPNQSVYMTVEADMSEFPAFRAKHANHKGPIYFFVVGFIDYGDIFGNEHRTTLCAYRFEGDGAGPRDVRLAPSGNSMR